MPPFGELRSASGRGGGGGGCNRCGRCCKKREVKALRWLCGLCFLGMFLLALPVLYLVRAKAAEKAAPEEILMETMPAPQKQHGNPPCHDCESPIRLSVDARVNANVSRSKCVNEKPVSSSLLWDIQSKEGHFQLDDESISFIIPRDGRYFVYSQVTFSCSRCNCEKNACCGKKTKDLLTVWQQVLYKTPGYDGLRGWLMSVGFIHETTTLNSLYLGAAMSFKKGDKLMVNVSSPALVEREPRYTFFGAYFVS